MIDRRRHLDLERLCLSGLEKLVYLFSSNLFDPVLRVLFIQVAEVAIAEIASVLWRRQMQTLGPVLITEPKSIGLLVELNFLVSRLELRCTNIAYFEWAQITVRLRFKLLLDLFPLHLTPQVLNSPVICLHGSVHHALTIYKFSLNSNKLIYTCWIICTLIKQNNAWCILH